jgi:hypothetical protein
VNHFSVQDGTERVKNTEAGARSRFSKVQELMEAVDMAEAKFFDTKSIVKDTTQKVSQIAPVIDKRNQMISDLLMQMQKKDLEIKDLKAQLAEKNNFYVAIAHEFASTDKILQNTRIANKALDDERLNLIDKLQKCNFIMESQRNAHNMKTQDGLRMLQVRDAELNEAKRLNSELYGYIQILEGKINEQQNATNMFGSASGFMPHPTQQSQQYRQFESVQMTEQDIKYKKIENLRNEILRTKM